MMENKINGLHHITVLASDPQRNYDFYTQVLGLRFVKKTVNFDAPDVYHLYYGDELGNPGTVLTFFPFPMAKRGTRGTGEASVVSFSIPLGSLAFWQNHLKKNSISFNAAAQKFGFSYISLQDPDGMIIELVEDDVKSLTGWQTEQIAREHSIRKFFGTTVRLNESSATEKLLTDVMGFTHLEEANMTKRYVSGEGLNKAYFEIQIDHNGPTATQSAGSIHHIAWRTENDQAQRNWIETLFTAGYQTTDVIDRNYFHSIYFREPGGVLFEIATDNPGFMIDEEKEMLGRELKLPEKYENRRATIEQSLKPIQY